MLNIIYDFIDNLDNSKAYHESIRSNLQRVKTRIQEKSQKLTPHPDTDSIFDYIVEIKKEESESGLDITREYSSKYSVCRVTYHKSKSIKHYYWSCCNSRKKSHCPYEEHRSDIEYVQKKID